MKKATIDLRCPCTRAFFQPASQTVGFSLQFTNFDHEITFLWFCSFENTKHVWYSFILHRAVKSKQHSRDNKIQDLTSGVFTGATKSSCFRKNLKLYSRHLSFTRLANTFHGRGKNARMVSGNHYFQTTEPKNVII